MGIQIATTDSAEDAQRIIVSEARLYNEQSAPCRNLVEHFKLGKGEKSILVPFTAKATAAALTDGVDMADSAAIGFSSTSLTTSEVGVKFIVSDKLVRQANDDIFRIIGKQGGEALARKTDEDIITIFDSFSEASGSTGTNVTMAFFMNTITRMEAGYAGTGEPAPTPYACVLHPYNVAALRNAVSVAGGTTYPWADGYSQDALKKWLDLVIGDVPIFRDGNISRNATSTCCKGAMFSKSAIAFVESQAPTVERERDASLRATEINFVTDYGCFLLKDDFGVEMQYYAPTPSIGP
jgi:hypothetical protein